MPYAMGSKKKRGRVGKYNEEVIRMFRVLSKPPHYLAVARFNTAVDAKRFRGKLRWALRELTLNEEVVTALYGRTVIGWFVYYHKVRRVNEDIIDLITAHKELFVVDTQISRDLTKDILSSFQSVVEGKIASIYGGMYADDGVNSEEWAAPQLPTVLISKLTKLHSIDPDSAVAAAEEALKRGDFTISQITHIFSDKEVEKLKESIGE